MLIIDRFEGNQAVVEYSVDKEIKTISLPKELLPSHAREGDVLEIRVNDKETKSRKKRIKKLSDELFE